ncbi:hypothetical protein DNH61_00145 [Paenibacillus sambharensis]|uniref:GGDEF domain-containing protein n=1 Tax=Paenibacillus sambharensis TaxID=1803190 RepID=A0A2W1LFW3_9BACL|nr:diguanylate cyclase [Paenibacillus sambharensis]PZD97713.1 hypothetical protein DNH61_00145 [Paenibacillus sambharensis]
MEQPDWNINRPSHHYQAFILLFATTLGFLGALLYLLFRWESAAHYGEIRQEELEKVQRGSEAIVQHLEGRYSDLYFLADLTSLHRIEEISQIQNGTSEVASEYISFVDRKVQYEQIHFFNRSGKQLFHIYRSGKTIHISEPGMHQDAGTVRYARGINRLAVNEVYISPLELYKNLGRVETPPKPVIHLGTPVFNQNKQQIGAIMVSLLASPLLDRFATASGVQYGYTELLNAEGYWLYSNDSTDRSWGFMFPHRTAETLPRDYPDEWKQMQASPSGQIRSDNGLFTYQRVAPFEDMPEGAYEWTVLSRLPEDKLEDMGAGMKVQFLIFAGVMLVLSAAVTWQYTKSRAYKQQLEYMALYDPVTGLPNRIKFFRALDDALKEGRKDQRFALLFLDLDGFKAVNDTYGHEAGDEVLRMVGSRLRGSVRSGDTLARMGGDEFNLLIKLDNGAQDAEEASKRILAALSAPFELSGGQCRVGASIGISLYDVDGRERETLLHKADSAMYVIKGQGKNGFAFYQEEEHSVKYK